MLIDGERICAFWKCVCWGNWLHWVIRRRQWKKLRCERSCWSYRCKPVLPSHLTDCLRSDTIISGIFALNNSHRKLSAAIEWFLRSYIRLQIVTSYVKKLLLSQLLVPASWKQQAQRYVHNTCADTNRQIWGRDVAFWHKSSHTLRTRTQMPKQTKAQTYIHRVFTKQFPDAQQLASTATIDIILTTQHYCCLHIWNCSWPLIYSLK